MAKPHSSLYNFPRNLGPDFGQYKGERTNIIHMKTAIALHANTNPAAKFIRGIIEIEKQRLALLDACKAWQRARNDGGISHADLHQTAWTKTQAAIERSEK